MKRWEYECIFIRGGGATTSRILDDYGRDGWELAGTRWRWHYFERELAG